MWMFKSRIKVYCSLTHLKSILFWQDYQQLLIKICNKLEAIGWFSRNSFANCYSTHEDFHFKREPVVELSVSQQDYIWIQLLGNIFFFVFLFTKPLEQFIPWDIHSYNLRDMVVQKTKQTDKSDRSNKNWQVRFGFIHMTVWFWFGKIDWIGSVTVSSFYKIAKTDPAMIPHLSPHLMHVGIGHIFYVGWKTHSSRKIEKADNRAASRG